MSARTPVTSRVDITAPPERVFAVVADADEFGRVAAGTLDRIRGPWPASGSQLTVRQAHGRPRRSATLTIHGCEPPHRLDLRAHISGALVSDVRLQLDDHNGGTGVSIVERPVSGPLAHAPDAVLGRWLRRRHARLLERLRERAVRTTRPTEGQQVTATDRGTDVENPHPEIAEAQRTGRGDPYAGLRDGIFESDVLYDPDHPTRPRRPRS